MIGCGVLAPHIPDNEESRLSVLRSLDILNSPPDIQLDALTALASEVCGTPVSLVTLVDRDRQWFKSNRGLSVSETARDVSFCGHAILQESVFEVCDALSDERFADNPLVTGAPFIRFYAGAPLTTREGFNIGTVCVIDTMPRQLTPLQTRCLTMLAKGVVNMFEVRKLGRELGTALLAQQELAQQKSWLVGYVSHEIRNLMTSMIGMLDLLSMGPLTAHQTAAHRGAEQSALALQVLVEDMLTLGQAEAGTLRLHSEPFDLRAQMRTWLAGHEPILRARGVGLKLEIDPTIPREIKGDAQRLGQLLLNLLGNASKVTSKGEVSVRVQRLPDPPGRQLTLRFSVTDTGPGMSEEQRTTLFVRNHARAENPHVGLGIGLYISDQLTKMMGGTIDVESELGRGSTFHVTLTFDPHEVGFD